MAVALRRSALWRPFLACIVVFSPFSAHAVLEAREKEDVYLGIYALGSLPVNTNVILAGMEATGTAVGKGGGAGIQVAIFPAFTNRMVGVELEYFAHGATLSFPLGIRAWHRNIRPHYSQQYDKSSIPLPGQGDPALHRYWGGDIPSNRGWIEYTWTDQ